MRGFFPFTIRALPVRIAVVLDRPSIIMLVRFRDFARARVRKLLLPRVFRTRGRRLNIASIIFVSRINNVDWSVGDSGTLRLDYLRIDYLIISRVFHVEL